LKVIERDLRPEELGITHRNSLALAIDAMKMSRCRTAKKGRILEEESSKSSCASLLGRCTARFHKKGR